MNKRVDALIRPSIRELNAYHVPPAKDLIKLDAMENPYTWPEAMIHEWLEVMGGASLNRYPDPGADQLRQRLKQTMGIAPDMEVILGNGSDELIQMLAMAVAAPDKVILAPEPSFVMYRMIATFVGMEYVPVALKDDFSLDLDAMLVAINRHQPALVFLAYPNNPTGNLFDEQQVRSIIEAAPGLVILDEAYHAFAGASFMKHLEKYDNLLVMRTLSKIGLAGLRLGLLAGRVEWLQEIDKVRLPYNINVLTQISADFALRHSDVLQQQTEQICHDREILLKALSDLEGIHVYPSRANFILFRVTDGLADEIFAGLKDAGVLIKNLNGAGGPLRDCLRVTVGKEDENNIFLQALQKVL
jgi:histidinol-phosphate aminotransferase